MTFQISKKTAIWLVLLTGLILRLRQYLYNRSLPIDEANLALNIIRRDYAGLCHPLSSGQGAPLGFLLVEKALTNAFGPYDYILALFPFIGGLIALFLFYKLMQALDLQNTTLIAVFLFALSSLHINFSTDCKQYSTDILMSIVILAMWYYAYGKKLELLKITLFGTVGAVAIWFSHPAIFILLAVGIVEFIPRLWQKQWAALVMVFFSSLIWSWSFLMDYLISLRYFEERKFLLAYWNDRFMPLLPFSWASIKASMHWLNYNFWQSGLIDIQPHWLIVALLLAGSWFLIKQNKKLFFIALFSFLSALIASAFHKYIFFGRFLVFLIPLLLIVVAAGAGGLITQVNTSNPIVSLITSLCLVLVLLAPIKKTLANWESPFEFEPIKPVLSYVASHNQGHDIIYFFSGSCAAGLFYAPQYDLNGKIFLGVTSLNNYSLYGRDIDRFNGSKGWFIFTHIRRNIFSYAFNYLSTHGKLLDYYQVPNASAFLFDLRKD